MKLHEDAHVRGLQRALAFYRNSDSAEETVSALNLAIETRLADIRPAEHAIVLSTATIAAMSFFQDMELDGIKGEITRLSHYSKLTQQRLLGNWLQEVLARHLRVFWERVRKDNLYSYSSRELSSIVANVRFIGDTTQLDWKHITDYFLAF